MALINCHECGSKISTEAKVCPSCGVKPKKPASRGAIGLALLVLGLFIYGMATEEPPRAKSPEEIAEAAKREREFQKVVSRLKVLKAAMNNPASFEVVTASVTDDGAVCVTYRATNGFNAITTGMYAFTDTSASDKVFDWNRLCAGKPATDYQHARRAI